MSFVRKVEWCLLCGGESRLLAVYFCLHAYFYMHHFHLGKKNHVIVKTSLSVDINAVHRASVPSAGQRRPLFLSEVILYPISPIEIPKTLTSARF